MQTETLIIGAGLAGLSAGFHLGSRNYTLVEAESSVGGLCRSFEADGFHFDCTGHLIHFRSETGRKTITELVGNKIQEHQRRAAIFLSGRFTDYPFQANTHGLPADVVKECLLGFMETLIRKKRKVTDFYQWVHEMFGDGIAKYFMVPYNEKLWQTDLREISLDWVNWSIPKPSLEEVINGALGIKNRQFGYNPVFYYPIEGGIQLLPDSFPIAGELIVNAPVAKVNLKKRRATLQNGTAIEYKFLFSTMPLHAFAAILEDAPALVRAAADKLRYVSVLNINLGIDRPGVIPYHWVYFPERDLPFYRIGSPTNFSANVAPTGTSSLFVEVSLRPDENVDIEKSVDCSIAALRRTGILRSEDKIVTRQPVLLKYAYVIFDHERKRAVERILRYLNSKDVYSFGRYGSWIYSSMEDAVLQGKEFAEKLKAD